MKAVDKQNYNMAIYESKKELHIQVFGFIKAEVVEAYLKDLHETVDKVPKQSYTFVVDATHQSPLPSKVIVALGETLMYYASLGFKETYIVYPKSKISKVQVRNALEPIDFPGTVVDYVSQITTK